MKVFSWLVQGEETNEEVQEAEKPEKNLNAAAQGGPTSGFMEGRLRLEEERM